MQQPITWANVDPELYCHIASLNHNKLTDHLLDTGHGYIEENDFLLWGHADFEINSTELTFVNYE